MKHIKIFSLLAVVIASLPGCLTPQVQSGGAAVAAPADTKENPYLKMIDQSLYTPFLSEKTGPLADSIPVKVAQWGILDGYDVIGYAEVQGETIQDRIILAERYARAYGGDVIMPKGVFSREQIKNTYRDRTPQGFLIWRKKPSPASVPPIAIIDNNPQPKAAPEKKDDSVLQDLTEAKASAEKQPDYPVYGKLPRLTYGLLMENKDTAKAQNYRGASYALKVYKIPEDLGIKAEADSMMAMLATRSGESKLFMIVPSSRLEWIQGMIKSDKLMEYVYKPLGVYKERYPVVQFVDEMK
jgi:hypothetical protein